jgi:pimeloyl-ACP methyl ester carboxylesterase
MAKIVFFHGLNTFGDDELHLGPLKFGPMHYYLEEAFHSRDIEFLCVTGIGAGRPDVLAARALSFLNEAGYFAASLPSQKNKIHFLGHSIGGLVARALASREEIHDQVASVITIGTPHHGTSAAAFGMNMKAERPLLHHSLKMVGYDTTERAEIFGHFTEDALRDFEMRFPLPRGIRSVSLVCEAQGRELSMPFQLAKVMGPLLPGDGLISTASQLYGEELGPFSLDHISELGYFFHTRPSARRFAATEFKRMVDVISEFVSN